MEHGRLGREPDDDLPHFSREVFETEDDSSSVVHVEVPPWAETYEISATTQEGARYLFVWSFALSDVEQISKVMRAMTSCDISGTNLPLVML